MAYDNVVYDVKDGVATITLNRPDAYNALNLALARDLFRAALEADESRDVRCIVITGAGRAFCAGGDVKDFADNPERLARIDVEGCAIDSLDGAFVLKEICFEVAHRQQRFVFTLHWFGILNT